MEVRHHGPRLGGNPADNLLGQQIGFYRGYTVAFNAFDSIEGTEQVEEFFTCIAAEVADIHAGDDNLAATFGSNRAGDLNDVVDTPRT